MNCQRVFFSRDALQCDSNQLSSSYFQHSQKGLLNLVLFRWALDETFNQTNNDHYLNKKTIMTGLVFHIHDFSEYVSMDRYVKNIT